MSYHSCWNHCRMMLEAKRKQDRLFKKRVRRLQEDFGLYYGTAVWITVFGGEVKDAD